MNLKNNNNPKSCTGDRKRHPLPPLCLLAPSVASPPTSRRATSPQPTLPPPAVFHGVRGLLAPSAGRRAVGVPAHGGLGGGGAPGDTMPRAGGAFVAALLVLVPVTGLPVLCRLLGPWEPWPGHIVEYQQIPVADSRNCLHKTALNMIVNQPALKKESRSYKNIKTNLETPRKNAERNHQQKNMLKDIILYQRNLYLISGESTTIQVLGTHLGPSELILRRKKQLTKISNNILKNEKLDVYKVRMNVFHSDKKKSQNKKLEQLQLIYFENSCKCMRTRVPLVITLQTKTMLKAEEAHFKKCQEDRRSILVLRLVKQQQSRGREHTVIQMVQKEKCKNNTDRLLVSAKERENFRENINSYTKDQHMMFLVVKQILNDKRKFQYREFKKYGQLFVSCQQKSVLFVKEKMKVQKWKTNKKTFENQKFPFIHAFTHHKGSYNTWKIFLAHTIILSHIKKNQDSTIKRKTSRDKNRIKTQSTLFKVFIRESKTRETGMGISSKLYYIRSSVINRNFLVIATARKIQGEVLSSEINQMKSVVYTVEMLKHFMQPSQKVNKYFNVHMGFRNSALKAFVERKHLSTERFLNMLRLHKHIFQVPSVVERTKRSTKGETIQIPAASLNRVTSALETCAVIFVIILLALFLAACYLFYKRRQLKQFLELILQHGAFTHKSESTVSKPSPPIPPPRDAHSGTSKESSKKQKTVARGSKTYPKEQERRHTAERPFTESYSKERGDTTRKEVNARSDTDRNSKRSHKGFTVRSKAYVFPSGSSESMESLCDDDVWETSSAEPSSSDESMENGFSNQPRSNTNKKENASISASRHSYKNRDHNPSSDVRKPRVSKSKSANDICTSSSTELRAVRSLTIFDGRNNP